MIGTHSCAILSLWLGVSCVARPDVVVLQSVSLSSCLDLFRTFPSLCISCTVWVSYLSSMMLSILISCTCVIKSWAYTICSNSIDLHGHLVGTKDHDGLIGKYTNTSSETNLSQWGVVCVSIPTEFSVALTRIACHRLAWLHPHDGS